MAIYKDIDTLLDLDGLVIEQAGGYWAKFEVKKLANSTVERPHGIRYSLTLHNRVGTRIMGFDNAHAVKKSKKGSIAIRKLMIIIIAIQMMKVYIMSSLMPIS